MQKLGRYDVLGKIGQGAMGAVFHGFDPHLDRRVAIKTILPGNVEETVARDLERRFLTEARSVARLRHPGIVSLYDVGLDAQIKFLVMELVEGASLHACLRHGVKFSIAGCLQIGIEVLAALEHAHRSRVIHRDIKPSNVLVEWSGAIRLADFGVAKIQEIGADNGTQLHGVTVGTLRYMSPEQALGQDVDGRSDIFSTGVMLYELLTAVWPFGGQGGSARLESLLFNDAPPASSWLQGECSELDAVLDRALQKKPDDRYRTAAEFRMALAALSQHSAPRVAISESVPATALVQSDSVTLMRDLMESLRTGYQDLAGNPDSGLAEPGGKSGLQAATVEYPRELQPPVPPEASSELVTRTRIRSTPRDSERRTNSSGSSRTTLPKMQDSDFPESSSVGVRSLPEHPLSDDPHRIRGKHSPLATPTPAAGARIGWMWMAGIVVAASALIAVLGFLWPSGNPEVVSQPIAPVTVPDSPDVTAADRPGQGRALPGMAELTATPPVSTETGLPDRPPIVSSSPDAVAGTPQDIDPAGPDSEKSGLRPASSASSTVDRTTPMITDPPVRLQPPPNAASRPPVARCSFLLEKAGFGEPLSSAEQMELMRCR